MRERIAKLIIMITIAVIALGGLAYALLGGKAVATTSFPDYDIVLESQNAPSPGRPAPYGQWVITHNNVGSITTTLNYGTVARVAGYDPLKSLICENTGSFTATINLYARTTSTGSLYDLEPYFTTVNPSARKIVSFTETVPWISIGITSTDTTTGTTMTCGVYVQTP